VTCREALSRGKNDDSETSIRPVSALLAKTRSITARRRNVGTFPTHAAAERHERAVHYFKHAPDEGAVNGEGT